MNGPYLAADVDDLVRRFVRPDMHVHFAATLSPLTTLCAWLTSGRLASAAGHAFRNAP